jgi:CCR4-NOT transcription complex subunit 3
MEKFKAVEKAMKTKAYSKEGLSAAAKLDPKERAKMETCDFLGDMVDQLQSQIEQMEVEMESIQATMKKGKTNSVKADRMAEIERISDRHKWHQQKLELIKRSLENGAVETEQVTDLEESIRYYVTDGMSEDFMEDEEMYDDLNLNEEEENYGMNIDNERGSSQDTQSIQEDAPEASDTRPSIPGGKSKPTSASEAPSARRASTQHVKSPLPMLASLHTPLSNTTNTNGTAMKPAALPQRAPGETLKYASAAAAAAEKSNFGIAPLPPPPEERSSSNMAASHPPLPSYSSSARVPSVTASPIAVHSQPVAQSQPSVKSTIPNPTSETPFSAHTKSPALSQSIAVPSSSSSSQLPNMDRHEKSNASRAASGKAPAVPGKPEGMRRFPCSHMDNVTNLRKLPRRNRMVLPMAPTTMLLRMSQFIISHPGSRTYFSHLKQLKDVYLLDHRNLLKECWHHLSPHVPTL